ncbi:MAG: Bax inhibitor-1/YccA family protein [Firmicutes bacterium]|nr:Bax inhibitor-1/YccA family protein [Bacillota bacterium]
MNGETRVLTSVEAVRQSFFVRVYGWMTLALCLTGLSAAYVLKSPRLLMALSDRNFFIGLLLGELAIVLILSAAIGKISATAATIGFLVYAVVNGLAFSVLFLVYTASSIASAFFVCAAVFGGMCLYGHLTKRDLTSLGSLLVMGLFGLVVASLVNLFLNNSLVSWVTTYAGLFIFIGLTAYDAQRLKTMAAAEAEGEEIARKAAVIGALALYLDFINLFLRLLRLLGKKR